ncbi:MAG: urease accessory protein UreD [Methylobacterium mesophilicum]|nr:urease accessory protein UreD [Methylobacterium mesophilicum]
MVEAPTLAGAAPARARARLQRAEGVARVAFRRAGRGTGLARLYQEGCAKLRMPAGRPGEPAHAVLINTAGGLTGGDRFRTEVEVETGASAILTTQACERIYRSTGENTLVSSHLRVGEGASLAWLPQETILFDGSRLCRMLDVDLAIDARFTAVEAVIFGRTAMGERVRSGHFHDRWRIRRGGRLLFADDLRFSGAIDRTLQRAAVLRGNLAMATLFHAGPDLERLLDPVREALGEGGGASVWAGKLVARVVAQDGLSLRRGVEPALRILMDGSTLPTVWKL